MKKWKKSAASMLLLLLMVSVAACGRNNGTAADENAGTGNEAGVEMDFWRRSEEMPMMWWMMW